MARPDKLPGFVGDNGNTEEPPNSLKTNGYSLDEVPQSKHHNWLFRKFSEWIAYFQKRGVPDYSSTVEYDTGDVVNDSGVLYVSLADANTGNAVSDDTKWKALNKAASVTVAPAGSIAATNVQAAIEELDTEKLALAGGTMTGAITLPNSDPSNNNHAARKLYVDDILYSYAWVDTTGDSHSAPYFHQDKHIEYLAGTAFSAAHATNFQVRKNGSGVYHILAPTAGGYGGFNPTITPVGRTVLKSMTLATTFTSNDTLVVSFESADAASAADSEFIFQALRVVS